jgi:hypothetical protein
MSVGEEHGPAILELLEAESWQLSAGGANAAQIAEEYGQVLTPAWSSLAWRDLILGNDADPAAPYYQAELRSCTLSWPLGDQELVTWSIFWRNWLETINRQYGSCGNGLVVPEVTPDDKQALRAALDQMQPTINELGSFAGLLGAWRRRRARL